MSRDISASCGISQKTATDIAPMSCIEPASLNIELNSPRNLQANIMIRSPIEIHYNNIYKSTDIYPTFDISIH